MKLYLRDKFKNFSPRDIWRMVFAAIACLTVGLFIKLTWELQEDSELRDWDNTILLLIGKLRHDELNGPMVDITALGSSTVVSLFCVIVLTVLLLAQQFKGAVFLLLSIAGAGAWSTIIKRLVQRERPVVLPHLVEVTHFSYPSGHTIVSTATFLALALLASRYFTHWPARILLFLIASALACLIGFSRLYLGVHYLSDILSGILLGAAWVFALAALFFAPHRLKRSESSSAFLKSR